MSYEFYPNAGPLRPITGNFIAPFYNLTGYSEPIYAGLAPGFVGLYQVNIKIPPVPPGTPVCTDNLDVGSNLTITVINEVSLDGFSVCVE